MDITFAHQISFKQAYGILCGTVPSAHDIASMMPTFCQVPSESATTLHSHFEPEIFFITGGQGEMTVGQETQVVSIGDLIQIPAYTPHAIRNTGHDTLEFLSVYSEDFEIPHLPQNVVITAAPPTPNGPLHLGHISGPYLASDIVTRYLRSHSSQVLLHSGTDDHQNYVSEKALSLNVNRDVFQKNQRQRIHNGLKNMCIAFDEFIEPKSDHLYQHKVLTFVQRTLQEGVIEKEVIEMPYCEHCDVTLIDSLIDGTCPSCFSPSRGCCETCGLVAPPYLLLNTHCDRCGKIAKSKSQEVYSFNLSRYFPLIENDLKSLNLSPRLKELIQKVKASADYKVLVSHPHNNHLGLKMPESNQAIHVWFEMAAHYESFSMSSNTWIHFFGFDNSFYYLIFIPALLKAMNASAKLPDAVVTNEFLLLDGFKFSTSRNHAIWADEFQGNTDHLRLYLMSQRPGNQMTNFSMAEFETFSEKLSSQIESISNHGRVVNSNAEKHSARAEQDVQRFKREFAHLMSLETLDLRQAAQRLLVFADHTIHKFGIPADDKLRIETLASKMFPFMPNTRIL